MNADLTNRHDVLVLFDVTNGNPNGDPDAGNMPRIDPNTNRGIVSDVCTKRKVRNYVEMFCPKEKNGRGYEVIIHQGAVINDLVDEAEEPAKKKADPGKNKDKFQEAALEYLCNRFFDLRTFGAVLSTGNKIFKGSSYGQVRGPVQVAFAQSYHAVTPLEITITRCAVTDQKEKNQLEAATDSGSGENRTMGRKYVISYALYCAKVFVSPAFAERTGFTRDDLEVFFEALTHLFDHDSSSARAGMIVRGIYDFEHVGTQHPNNSEQNKKEARLGCWHAHKLFEGIKVSLKPGKTLPESFDDYLVDCSWTEANLPKGVILNLRHEVPVKTIRFTT